LDRVAAARYAVDKSRDAVALTFDDGPDPTYTPQVLDLLAEARVPATFFLVGRRAAAQPGLVRRMLEEGHAVGSHSRSHPDPATQQLRQLVCDYGSGRRMVESVTGVPVPLFRPPMGNVGWPSAVAMRCSRVVAWLWTRDPNDWLPGRRRQDIVDALGNLQAGDVVLLHDSIELPRAAAALDRSETVAAIPEVITSARSRGLSFVTLPA
jgi:peptidoglycan/xylan/chitin deacetylase (PgdA/CDA1 family)